MAKSKKKKNIKKKNYNKKRKKQNIKKKTSTKKNIQSNNNTSKKEKLTTNNKIKQKEKLFINKTKVKNNNYLFYLLIIIFIISLLFILYKKTYVAPTPSIKDVKLVDEDIVVEFKINHLNLRNKVYCLYKENDGYPNIDDKNWVLSKNNKCTFKLEKNVYNLFLKNEDKKIIKVNTNNIGYIKDLKINSEKIYIPINDTYKLDVNYEIYGNHDNNILWTSDNEKIAVVDSNGKVKGVSKGTTNINAIIGKYKISSEVNVTNLITKRPKSFDLKKGYLPCNKYSKEENDKIDEILKNKINDAGYKTRAGVVEAARFLTLDFPYRINYFYENGRQTTNNVDGEGRYYHVGFYLHKSRYKNITGSRKGPKTWGCSLYSSPAHRYIDNGLDCSGFVSWALLNGGFDVKDVGAGWSNNRDLTDYGKVKRLTSTLSTSNKIKVGDLLHSERAGGHIGIIVGIDSKYYYVAQALWYDEIGVIITKHKKKNLNKSFPHVVLMDKYYKKDGNLTNMW